MFFVALTLIMGISLTSCLDSGSNSNSFDFAGYATVGQGYLGSGLVLTTDDGITLTPTNPSFLLLSDGTSYPERIYGYYKLVEGEVLQNGKTSYNVTIVSASLITTKDFNQRPDTLKNDYSIASFDGSWIANGYANVGISFYYTTASNVSFDMYEQRTGHDTLYVKLNYSKGGGTSAYNQYSNVYSFRMPTYIDGIEPEQDSIWVKISANGTNGILEKSVRCKYEY